MQLHVGTSEHVIAALMLVSRIYDLGSTYLYSPKLLLEANPIARRLGWRFGFVGLLVCFLPYFNMNAAMFVLVASFLAAHSNIRGLIRKSGTAETKLYEQLLEHARRTHPFKDAGRVFLRESPLLLAGSGLLVSYPERSEPAHYFAMGMICFVLIACTYSSLMIYRIRRQCFKETAERLAAMHQEIK